MTTIVDAYSPYVVVPKLPTYKQPYSNRQNTDPSAYYTKALGFLPIDTRYLANTTNSLTYNSMADVLFNKAAWEKRWANSNASWMADWWATPIRSIADTLLLLKDKHWDPIRAGVKEDGFKGFLRGNTTSTLNALVDFGNTLDILANPIKGLFIDGVYGFKKGLFGDEDGRKQYDYSQYIDTGDYWGSGAVDLILSLAAEIVSDPLNWITWGTKAAASTGTKGVASGFLKSIRKTLSESIEQGTKSVDDLTKVLVKNTDVTEKTAKELLTELADDTGEISVDAINKAFNTAEDLTAKVGLKTSYGKEVTAKEFRKIAAELGQSQKGRYKASLLGKSTPMTPGVQKFTSEYLIRNAEKLPDLFMANKAFKYGTKIGKGVRSFETGLRYIGGTTSLTPVILLDKLGKYVKGVYKGKQLLAKQKAVIKTILELDQVTRVDTESVELVEAFGGAVEAAVHKEIFNDLLKVKDTLTGLFSKKSKTGKEISVADLIKTQNRMIKKANNVIKKLNRADIQSLDDYINYFKTLNTVTDVSDYIETLETLKRFLNEDYTNAAVLEHARASARTYVETINTTLTGSQEDALANSDEILRRWRGTQEKMDSVTKQLNDTHQGVDQVMEWIEGDTGTKPNLELLDEYMDVAKQSMRAERQHTVTTLVPDSLEGATEEIYVFEDYYRTFKEHYLEYQRLQAEHAEAVSDRSSQEIIDALEESIIKARKKVATSFQDLANRLRADARFPEYSVSSGNVVKNKFGATPITATGVIKTPKYATESRYVTSDTRKLYNPDADIYGQRHLITESEQAVLDQFEEAVADDEYLNFLKSELAKAIEENNKTAYQSTSADIKDYMKREYGALVKKVEYIRTHTYFKDTRETIIDAAGADVDSLTKFIQDLPVTHISKTDVLASPAEYIKYQLVTYQIQASKTSFHLNLCGIDSTGRILDNTDGLFPMRTLLDEYTDKSSPLYKALTQGSGYTEVELTQYVKPMRDLLDRLQGFISLVREFNKLTEVSNLGELYQQGITDQLVTMLSKWKKVQPYQIPRIASDMLDGVDMFLHSHMGLSSNSMDTLLGTVSKSILDNPTASPGLKQIATDIQTVLASGQAHEAMTDVENWIRFLNISEASDVAVVQGFKENLRAFANGRYIVVFDEETIGTTERLARPYQISGKVLDPDLNVVPGSEFNIIIHPGKNVPWQSVKRIIAPTGEDPTRWFNRTVVNNPEAISMEDAINKFYDICNSYAGKGGVILAGHNIKTFDINMLLKHTATGNRFDPGKIRSFFENVDKFDSLNEFNIRNVFQLQDNQRALFKKQVESILSTALAGGNKAFGQAPFSYTDVNTLREFGKFATEKQLFENVYLDAQRVLLPVGDSMPTPPAIKAMRWLRKANPDIIYTHPQILTRDTSDIKYRVIRNVSDPSQYGAQALRNKEHLIPFEREWAAAHDEAFVQGLVRRARAGEINIEPATGVDKSIFVEATSARNWLQMVTQFNNKYPNLLTEDVDVAKLVKAGLSDAEIAERQAKGMLEALKDLYTTDSVQEWAAVIKLQGGMTHAQAKKTATALLTKAQESIDEFIEVYERVLTANEDTSYKILAADIQRLQQLADDITAPYDTVINIQEFRRIRAKGVGAEVLDAGDIAAKTDDPFDAATPALQTRKSGFEDAVIQPSIDKIIKMWEAPSRFKGSHYFTVSRLNPQSFEKSVKGYLDTLAAKGLIDVAPGMSIMDVFTRNVDAGKIILNPRKIMSYEVEDVFDTNKMLKHFKVEGAQGKLRFYDMEYMEHQMRAIKRNYATLSEDIVGALEEDAKTFIKEVKKAIQTKPTRTPVRKADEIPLPDIRNASQQPASKYTTTVPVEQGGLGKEITVTSNVGFMSRDASNQPTVPTMQGVIKDPEAPVIPTTEVPTSVRYVLAIRSNLDAAQTVAAAEYYYACLPDNHVLKLDKRFKLLGDRMEVLKNIREAKHLPRDYTPTPFLHRMNEIDGAVDQPRYMYETDYYDFKKVMDALIEPDPVDAILKYYLENNLYNVNAAAIHSIMARSHTFMDRVNTYLNSKGSMRETVETNMRKLNTRLYEHALMEILERPDRVSLLKSEARIRASRIVFATPSKIDLSDFKADPDFLVKDNVLLDAESNLYGHAILIKRNAYDAASKDVTLSPKMIESLEDVDAEGMQLLIEDRRLKVNAARIKNLGYSRGDLITSEKIQSIDHALLDLGWFTQEDLALIPSVNDLKSTKFFNDMNANNSIIGTYPFYEKMFGADIIYIGDPFRQTVYNLKDMVHTKNVQHVTYAGAIMNEYSSIKAPIFEGLTPADKFKILHNNEDVGVYIIREPTVDNDSILSKFYSDKTRTGIVMEEVPIVNIESIAIAEKLNAYVIPRTIARQAMGCINDFELPLIAQIAKDISDVYKVAYLGSVGFLVRNFIDSNYKTRWGLDGEVPLPKQIKHLFSTMKVLNKYTDAGQQYFKIMGRDFSTDLEYNVFYNVCKNLDKTEEEIIQLITQGLQSDRIKARVTTLTKQILKEADVQSLRSLASKLLEPDVFSIVHAFNQYGPSTGLTRAVSDNLVKSNEDRLLRQFNDLMTERTPLRYVYNANEFIEASARLSMFLQDLERGSTIDVATRNIIRTHFDYSDKTLGMLYTEIVFPFMSFSYKNLAFWLDCIERNPLLVGELENIFRSILDYQSMFNPDQEAYKSFDYTFDWSKDVADFRSNAPWAMINAARLYHILSGNVVIDMNESVSHDSGYGAKDNDLYTVFKLSPSVLDAVQMLYNPLNAYYKRMLPPVDTMVNVASGLGKGEDVVEQMNTASLANMLPYVDVVMQRIGIDENGLKHNNLGQRIADGGILQAVPSVFGMAYVSHKDQMYYYDSDYNILGGFKQNYYGKRVYGTNPYNTKNPQYVYTRLARSKRKAKPIYSPSIKRSAYSQQYNSIVRGTTDRILRYRIRDYHRYY